MSRFLQLLGTILICGILLFSNARAAEQPIRFDLYKDAEIFNAKDKSLTIEEVQQIPEKEFRDLHLAVTDLGFTTDHYWVKGKIIKAHAPASHAYLEVARPITDTVFLYLKQGEGFTLFRSGDRIPWSDRAFNHRKSIFPIDLTDVDTLEYYVHLTSDGETINMPLALHSTESLFSETYSEQVVYGFFYGILILAFVIYLFFYFAMRDSSFLYYSLYVLCIGIMHFSIDGFLHQYIAPRGGLVSGKALIFAATVANVFLAAYAMGFLKIRMVATGLYRVFQGIIGLLFVWMIIIPFVPALFPYSYPAINLIGFVTLIMIYVTLVVKYVKFKELDGWFAGGITFLVIGFTLFILNNFSLLPNNFITANASKLGTGLEIIFLSMSMSNLIRKLRSEKEKMQYIALQRSEEMNKIKTYFLSNMSHELRTPLNSIMGNANSVLTRSDDKDIRESAQLIQNASMGLMSSVNDILDFSMMEQGRLRLDMEEFNLSELVLSNLKYHAQNALDKGIDFIADTSDLSTPIMVIGDPLRISQIMNNILDNAVKFTERGEVDFSVKTESADNQMLNLKITVKDTGQGIEPEKVERVFEIFSQERIDNKRQHGGFGLGLSIVKALVDLFGGSVTIDSTQGIGTKCEVRLSLTQIPTQKKNTHRFPEDTYDLLGSKVLVVEDNPMNQMVIKTLLGFWKGTEIEMADNGLEALDKLGSDNFDIILMDLQMPQMDGYEATEAIRSGQLGDEIKQIPIIALTADVTDTARKRTRELGMNGYITKPVDQKKLYEAMTAALSAVENFLT